MGLRLSFLGVWLSMSLGFSASWYLDKDASGSNNGTSWANAWQTPGAINWAGMSAGDTLFISGGSTTKDYSSLGDISVGKSGTAASPITVRVGQDSGHNGVVYMGTNRIGSASGTGFGITINGHRGLAYSNPTNWLQVDAGDWTNNIGFWSHGRTGGTSTDTDPVFSYWTEGADHLTYEYYRISGFTNTFSGGGSGLDERGIIFNAVMENIAITNINFRYLWLHGNSGSPFTFTSATNNFHDGVEVAFCKIENNGEDHFKVHGGWTIHDSVIGPVIPDDAHCDFFQITGGWFKLYNCYVKESQHSYFRFQSNAGKDPANPLINGNIWVYNNLFSEIPGRSPYGGTYNEGMVFVNLDSAIANGGYVTWSNINLMANTFYGSEINTYQDPDEMARNLFISWTKGQYVTNAYLKSIRVLNNIFHQKHKGYAFPSTTNTGGVTGAGTWVNYEPFTTNDFVVNTNIFAGTNTSILTDPRVFSYLDVSDEIETHTYKFANKSNAPVYVDLSAGDFELSSGDTAARNAGMDLSSYFTTDSLNRPRNVGGAWDIGALEAQETNLLVHLNFEDDFTLSRFITDQSGNGNHAHQFGYTGSAAGSNFPNRVSASATPGTNTSTYAGDFDWYSDGHGIYGRSGDYGAITNITQLTNLTAATIMVRARYNSAYGGDYTEDANAELLSAGSAVNTRLGSWDFGRWNQQIHLNQTRFIITTNSNQSTPQVGSESDRFFGKAGRLVARFDDGYIPINDGNTTNWNHYAITWAAGILTLYQNGSPIGTNDVSGSTTTLNVGAGWIGVGCNTHVGTNPYLDDGESPAYPNNGFLNGAMDDVMIYSRALSAAEVASASGYDVDSEEGGGGGLGEESSFTRSKRTGKQVNRGKVVWR